MRGAIVAIAAVALAVALPAATARADCATVTDGMKPEAHIFYNSSAKVYQYCDGTNWRAMLGTLAVDPSLATLTDVDDALGPGGGDCLVYSSAAGEWGSESCAGAAGGDDLGDHAADQNIILGPHWLSGDGGNEGVYIDADGNVGIGTVSPIHNLEIESGNIFVTNSGAGFTANLYLGDDPGAGAGTYGFLRWSNDGDYISLGTQAGGPTLNVDNVGNVGIGETDPQASLHVDGTVRLEDFLTCTALETNASGDLVCGTDGGISVETDPQVNTLTGSKWCAANAGGTAIDCTADAPLAAETDPEIGAVTDLNYCRGDGSAAQCNRTITNVRDDIKTVDGAASGLDADLLDGFQSTSSGDRWGVIAPVGTDGVMEVGKYIDFHDSDGDATDYAVRLIGSPGDLRVNGSVTATAFLHLSDRRLKSDIVPVHDPLAVVTRLQGVHFNWKENGKPSFGVIAQDVEQVIPEAVTTGTDGIKAVDYDQLIAPLIEAVKAQDARIRALETEVEALQNAQGR